MTKIILAGDSLTDLYRIPEKYWTSVNKRAGGTIAIATVVSDPGERFRAFRHFGELLKSSRIWKDETFPGLVEQSRALSDYASQAIRDFARLKSEIARLGKHSTRVPDNVRQMGEATIERLEHSTIPLNKSFSKLLDQIELFNTVNQRFETDLGRSGDRRELLISIIYRYLHTTDIVPEQLRYWIETSLIKSMQSIEHAAERVQDEWKAISGDLKFATSGRIDITVPFLMGLDIDVAVRSWRRIQMEAKAFWKMAEGQQKNLTGHWLIETGSFTGA